jgi:hypothetical protein
MTSIVVSSVRYKLGAEYMTRLLLPVGVLAVVMFAMAIALRRPRKSADDPAARVLGRVALRAVALRAIGLLAGGVVALKLAYAPPTWLGLGLAIAAPALSLCVLAGVLAGEAAGYGAAGSSRSASLVSRSPRAYLPRPATEWVIGLSVTLLVLLTAATAAASPDDMGRAGRSLTVVCRTALGGSADGPDVSSRGPWPGAFYSIPIGLATVAGLIAAVMVLLRIAHRPRPAAAVAGLDDALRRRSSKLVVAALGLLVSSSVAGVAFTAGGLLAGNGCGVGWLRVLGWFVIAVGAVGFVASAAFLTQLLVPGRARAADVR